MNPPTLKKAEPGFEGPQAPLEAMFLDEFLQSKGFSSIKDLCKLPENEAKRIMIDACRFASLKLAEIEARSQFKKEIHVKD